MDIKTCSKMLCKTGIGDALLPSEVNDVWSTHTQILTNDRTHRQGRPRSSPIRSITDVIRGQHQIFTVPLTQRHTLLQKYANSVPSVAGTESPNEKKRSISNKSAYFSIQPPWMPIQLIPLNSTSAQLTAPPPIGSISPLATVPSTPVVIFNVAPRSPSPKQRSYRTVKRLLRDFFTSLPLPTVAPIAAPAYTSTSSITNTLKRMKLTTFPVDSHKYYSDFDKAVPFSTAALLNNRYIHTVGRSIAIQAEALQASATKDVHSSATCSEKSQHESNEWMGGVRALRDSHVRLVLRQLRHIERLNRAIDHAAQPIDH